LNGARVKPSREFALSLHPNMPRKSQERQSSNALEITTNAALSILSVIKETSDIVPPLQIAASISISILESVKVRFSLVTLL
jgi:hypothetical protein